jgi:beta-glucosidase
MMRRNLAVLGLAVCLVFAATSGASAVESVLGQPVLSAVPAKPLDTPAVPANAACRDPAKSPAERAASLLSLMTLDEMVGQMTQAARDQLKGEENIANWTLGSLLSGGGSAPNPNRAESWANMYDRYQAQALRTRLAIPLVYGIDAVHGNNNVWGSTIFPHNVGLGATRNPALVEQAARITAREMVGLGLTWTFAPCVTVPQDPRWGRTYEGFSEDTALVTSLGTAATKGFQGGTGFDKIAGLDSVLACVKHYIGDGGTTGGVDRGDAALSEAELRSKYLPPYVEAIKAGAATVMVSYSSWNKMRMHEQKYLITDVLKGELGFQGFVVSDWAAIRMLKGTPREQVIRSINAGLDMIMVPDTFQEFEKDLKAAVLDGQIPLARIQDAVRRILTVKFQMGLFERPYASRAGIADIGSVANRAMARQAVRESQVVLKNEAKTLPLAKAGKVVAVFGMGADNIGIQCGGWTISWQGGSGTITPGTSLLDGFRQVAPGNTYISPSIDELPAKIDVAIVVGSEMPYAEMKGDNQDLEFQAFELRKIKTLKELGIPVVTVVLSGRPVDIREALANSAALVAAWLPGTEGAGVADVLFGDFKPTGKLPYTWFESTAALPVHSNKPAPGVLFPLGYGLGW